MHAHDSTGFHETVKNQKMVTKRDGTQEPYSTEELTKSLSSMCDGFDMNYINVDIIVGKVSMGLPQGK
jgi:transcriptional regulator NrdR family protein